MILDEGILTRQIGRATIMRGQLRRLAEAAESMAITIQVLPMQIGASPGLGGPFTILSLPEPIPDIGYTEGIGNLIQKPLLDSSD